jgi:hypothetical protein
MTVNTRAQTALVTAVNAAFKHVPFHPYVFETDRWLDLIVLLLVDFAGLTKAQAVAIAGHLSVTRASKGQNRKFTGALKKNFQKTISSPDFDHDRVGEAAASIDRLSQEMGKRYGGGIQTFLRSHGERMASELSAMLQQCGVPASKSRRVAIVWLQNVANMPLLSVDDEHITSFCKTNNVTKAELLKVADAMSLNVAYLDDVLLVEHQRASHKKARKARKAPGKKT